MISLNDYTVVNVDSKISRTLYEHLAKDLNQILKLLVLTVFLLFFVSVFVIVNAVLVGDGKKESDVILVGKVVSFEENIPQQETYYQVDVDEYLKTPKNYDTSTKTVTITSPGLPKHPELANLVIDGKAYSIGDRVLFLLYYKDGKLEETLYSQTTKSDCSPKQLLDQMYGESGFSITQNNQSEHLYTNKPVDLTFYIYNRDLASEKKDFEFTVFTPNGKISEKRHVQLHECKRSAGTSWSFTPTVPGKYTFSATIGNNEGGSESFSGIMIEDYVASPLQQFKSGISIEKIQCRQGLLLAQKNDNTPICIKPKSLDELNYRRVANCVWNCTMPIPVRHIDNDITEKPKPVEPVYNLKKRTILYSEPSYLDKVDLTASEIPKDSAGRINYDELLYTIAKQKYVKIFEKNDIPITPNDIFLMTGPSITMYTELGYACGYTNANNQTFWLESRLNKDTMTELKIYNDNPDQCKPSYSSCFCEAQKYLAKKTTNQLSYFDEYQVKQIGKDIQNYFNNGNKIANVNNSFVVGKYNMDLGAGTTQFCGQFKGKPHQWYFHGSVVANKIAEFSLDLDKKQKLCAIKDDAQVFTFDESAIVKDPQ